MHSGGILRHIYFEMSWTCFFSAQSWLSLDNNKLYVLSWLSTVGGDKKEYERFLSRVTL